MALSLINRIDVERMMPTTRRHFLKLGLAAMACSMATPALAVMPGLKDVRRLAFRNLHTDEKLNVAYWR
ncbi:MAG: twin-arginine translocation signal domain-containing protein, partial [Bdellovibrionales bacterium]